MDAVLGLSVTPSAVGLVLVDGCETDGATMNGEGFEVNRHGATGAAQTSERATAAVRRTEAIAADRGQRVHSIGVTWSDDADVEASLLVKSLNDAGFDNVVPVRLSEATDALARGIAEVTGYDTTAVCVIEPPRLIAMVVHADTGALQTAVNHTVVTEEDLVGWLSSVFAKTDWSPQALVLVGSAEDLDGLSPVLEDALSVPVFAPPEAGLALARGAALACAQPAEHGAWATDGRRQRSALRRGARRVGQAWPAAMLAAGAVTFVASASAAVALHLGPEQPMAQSRPTADSLVQTPVAVSRPAPQAPAPAPEAPALPEAPAEEIPAAEPVTLEEAAPIIDAVPAEVPADVPLPEAPLPDSPGVPIEAAPPAGEVVPPPVPEQQPGLLQRIRDRLAGVGGEPVPEVPPVAPAPVPPLP
ncbi:hypothetical protein JDV09_20845 [Mycobacterium sp. Y57]|uniref:DUF7159 family protein n=1 Tax=Mycolicibacterium xanthum TaxID=2796469 RepID=UPI001C851C92|nr:hypothetical protein [Mycolicibacterium xanthum]MBX7434528.1 hypothetical protein [Mycolicibacterium xanthum]